MARRIIQDLIRSSIRSDEISSMSFVLFHNFSHQRCRMLYSTS